MKSLIQLAADLENGTIKSRDLVENSLARIADPSGEGSVAFLKVDEQGARAAADYQDGLRARGYAPSPFAGIPFSVKDLFDLAGQVTTAGSKILKNAEPAHSDAVAIAALKQAGLVVLGRTNMTEFAYSGLGLNSHYGTPRSSFQREIGRIPGGSSSGAAVAVADGMCALSIGSDTGGSCRIPAAYNGIVGFKPSCGRVSTLGAFPLSSSLDSIGPLGNTIQCCAIADALMAGDWDGKLTSQKRGGFRIGVLKTYVQDGLEPEVHDDFERMLAHLRSQGNQVDYFYFEPLNDLPNLLKRGGIVGAEAHAVHRERLASGAGEFDPLVASRLQLAGETSASDYINLNKNRAAMIAAYIEATRGFDAIAVPTVVNIPPRFSEIDSAESYAKFNSLSLRNTYVANFINLCAISIPMNRLGTAPTGFSLMAPHGADISLFNLANSII